MFEEIVGNVAPALQAVLSRAVKVAATDSTVSDHGPKREPAKSLLQRGHPPKIRSGLTSVSSGVKLWRQIARDLIASELFGHEKGALYGARLSSAPGSV